jgi:pimeloyl-ACP methyl ester carboxylesterase
MRGADQFLDSLDRRATVVETEFGPIQVAREGEGPAVLVSHGGPGGFDQGLMYGRHLRDVGREVIAPSRPGYLGTPIESGRSPVEQADLMAAVLDELGVEQATILGYSSGGPAAVHLAARHPERVRVLLLDSAVTMKYETPGNVVERVFVFSTVGAWWWQQAATRWPKVAVSGFVDGFSTDLDKQQKQQTAAWLTSEESRQRLVQDLWLSFGPWRARREGFANDEHNEPDLDPLPFSDITCPTLVSHGLNDGAVPVEHARHASGQITGAELILVEQGTHLLPTGRDFDAINDRQLELSAEDAD